MLRWCYFSRKAEKLRAYKHKINQKTRRILDPPKKNVENNLLSMINTHLKSIICGLNESKQHSRLSAEKSLDDRLLKTHFHDRDFGNKDSALTSLSNITQELLLSTWKMAVCVVKILFNGFWCRKLRARNDDKAKTTSVEKMCIICATMNRAASESFTKAKAKKKPRDYDGIGWVSDHAED